MASCIENKIENLVKKHTNLTKEEVAELVDKLTKEFEKSGLSPAQFKEKKLKQSAKNVESIKSMNAHNKAVFEKNAEFMESFRNAGEGRTYRDAIESLYVGTEYGVAGAKDSVDHLYRTYTAELKAFILNAFDKGELSKLKKLSEAEQVEVFNLIDKIHEAGKPDSPIELKEQLMDLLDTKKNALHRYANNLYLVYGNIADRIEAFGVNINREQVYAGRQFHNKVRMLNPEGLDVPKGTNKVKAAKDAWANFTLDVIDWEETFNTTDPATALEMLGKVFDNIMDRDYYTFENTGTVRQDAFISTAKRLTAERELVFKGDGFIKYNTKYGSGSLFANMNQTLDFYARNIAITEKLGFKPENMHAQLKNYAKGKLKKAEGAAGGKEYTDLDSGFMATLDSYFNTIVNKFDITSHQLTASTVETLKGLANFKMLGSAVISSITDIAVTGLENKKFNGGYLQTFFSTFKNILDEVVGDGERLAVLEDLGWVSEGMLGAALERFAPMQLPGTKARSASQFVFKYSGLNWWTNTMKKGFLYRSSKEMFKLAGQNFDELKPELRNTLIQYNINEADWKIFREVHNHIKENGKHEVLTPTWLVSALTNLKGEGFEGAKELSTKLRMFMLDRANYAVLTPTAKDVTMMQLNTTKGSSAYAFVSLMMHMKSFGLTSTNKIWGQMGKLMDPNVERGFVGTVKGVAGNSKMQALQLAGAMWMLTMMGDYIKMATKGQTVDLDDEEWFQNFAIDSFKHSGIGGIFQEFIQAMDVGYGETPVSNLMGPVLGVAEDLVGGAEKGIKYWTNEENERDLEALIRGGGKFLYDQTAPNLWYAKGALDHFIKYGLLYDDNDIYEMEDRLERKTHKKYFLQPTSYTD